jgi:CheY-like chemotaxis protein
LSLRILVVDDNDFLRRPLRAVLEDEGYRVTVADGGRTGIEALLEAEKSGDRFAAVVTDLEMPDVDGRKVAAAAKRMKSAIPVILLSGWGERLKAERAVPPEVDRVIAKPPKLAELRRALTELLAGQSAL